MDQDKDPEKNDPEKMLHPGRGVFRAAQCTFTSLFLHPSLNLTKEDASADHQWNHYEVIQAWLTNNQNIELRVSILNKFS